MIAEQSSFGGPLGLPTKYAAAPIKLPAILVFFAHRVLHLKLQPCHRQPAYYFARTRFARRKYLRNASLLAQAGSD